MKLYGKEEKEEVVYAVLDSNKYARPPNAYLDMIISKAIECKIDDDYV